MKAVSMSTQEVIDVIQRIEARIEFLKNDKTVYKMPWEGSTYNHGPYYRKLETKRLKARLKTLNKKLQKIA
jgi:hypothetical protein